MIQCSSSLDLLIDCDIVMCVVGTLTRRSVPGQTPEYDSCSERGGSETRAQLRTSLR